MEFKRNQLVNNSIFFLTVLLVGITLFIVITMHITVPLYNGAEKISLLEMIFINAGK